MIRFGESPEPTGIAARAIAARNGGSLDRYETACRAVADAKSVDEVKEIRDQAEAMRAYAKQAKNKQLELDAVEIRNRAERRIGELMAAQSAAGLTSKGAASAGWKETRVDAPITLAEAGIDKNLADRARKYAAIPEEKFEAILAERRERIEQENERTTVDLLAAADKHVRGTFGTGENEWYTPDEYLDLAREVLGEIDLDPASTDLANERVRARRIFTIIEDGLAQPWSGKVWLNPPYSQPAIAHFADKMVEEWTVLSQIEAAIVLTHNYTDTAWFQQLAGHASAICFTRGRVRFVSPSGELAAPTQGQAFFYFGGHAGRFAEVFGDTGIVLVRP